MALGTWEETKSLSAHRLDISMLSLQERFVAVVGKGQQRAQLYTGPMCMNGCTRMRVVVCMSAYHTPMSTD